MSLQGIVILDVLGLCLIALVLNLVAKGRLYAGYAALWMTAVGVSMILISIPALLEWVTRAVGAIFPVSALTLLAFSFMFLVLILFSVKLTLLTERYTELVQALALRELNQSEQAASDGEHQAQLELAEEESDD